MQIIECHKDINKDIINMHGIDYTEEEMRKVE